MSMKFSIRSSSMSQILGLKTLSNSSNLMYKLLNLLKYINQGRSKKNLLGNGELAWVPNSAKSPRTQVCPPSPTRIIQKRKTKEVTSIASPKLQPWIGNTNLLYHGQRTNHQSPIYEMRVPNLSEEEENILIAGNHTASASLSLSLGIHSKDRKESSRRKRKGGSGKSASSSNGPFGTSTATSTSFGSWSSSSSRSPPSQLGTLHTTRQIRSLATTSKRASSQCSSPGLASASSSPSPMLKTSIDLSPRRHRGFISSNRVHHCLQPPSLSLSYHLCPYFFFSFFYKH